MSFNDNRQGRARAASPETTSRPRTKISANVPAAMM